ncbi:MAG: hypothetical protein ABSH51_24125 [Solirubrobacteraceae bacterium]
MTRIATTIAVLAACITIAGATVPATASASVAGTLCTLTGLVSGVAGKLCSAAGDAGKALGAGRKLLSGHLGGAVSALTGGGAAKTGGRVAGLAATANVIGATTHPDLESTWFSASYWRMAAVSALLTMPFLFAAAVQAMLRSDLGLLLRATFGYLPLGLLAVAIAAPVTTLLLAGSDELSAIVSSASGSGGGRFLDDASAAIGLLTLPSGSLFLAFFVGLLTIAATIALWVELLIRDAAVYVIVLMLPLFFAAMVWPARRVWAIRAVETLVALILSKFVIVAVLALGAAALGHSVLPGTAASLAGVTLVLLAAFSPWALLRLLPLHELAGAAAAGLGAPPAAQLVLAGQRGWVATDEAERVAAEIPERLRAFTSAADRAPDADDGATEGEMEFGHAVGAGLGRVAAEGAGGTAPSAPAEPDAAPAGAPAGAPAPAAEPGPAGTTPAAQPPPAQRRPGMEAPFQIPDDELPTLTLDASGLAGEPPLLHALPWSDPPDLGDDPLAPVDEDPR